MKHLPKTTKGFTRNAYPIIATKLIAYDHKTFISVCSLIIAENTANKTGMIIICANLNILSSSDVKRSSRYRNEM